MTRNELEYITKWLEVNANASKFHNVYDMLEQFKLDFSPMIEEGQTFNSEECKEDDQSLDFVPEQHRVKKEPKYRPFKDIEECWNEMKKHHPFGYVKSKYDGSYIHYKLITKVSNTTTVGKAADCVIEFQNDTFCYHDMVNLYENYTFADGTPFGIKED